MSEFIDVGRLDDQFATTRELMDGLVSAVSWGAKLETALAIAQEQNRRDHLTGLFNRKGMEETFEQLKSSHQYRRKGDADTHLNTHSVLAMDIDNFKDINDKKGHVAGDAVLKGIGNILTRELRARDVPSYESQAAASRPMGDEFVILMPRTPKEGSVAAAERIRLAILINLSVTVSIGAAELDMEKNLEENLQTVDAALYEAKNRGRNLVVQAPFIAWRSDS